MILVSHIVRLTVFNPFYFSCIKFRNSRVDYTRLKDLFSRILRMWSVRRCCVLHVQAMLLIALTRKFDKNPYIYLSK